MKEHGIFVLPTKGWAKKFTLGSNPYKGESVEKGGTNGNSNSLYKGIDKK